LRTALSPQREPMGTAFRQCPICDSTHLEYEFVVDRSPVCGCRDCGLLFLNPQPGPEASEEDRRSSPEPSTSIDVYETNAAERIQELTSYSGLTGGTLVLVGASDHLRAEAGKAGFQIHALSAQEFESASKLDIPAGAQACILFCALERMRDPLAALQKLHGILDIRGCLMVISPTTDSRAARLLRTSWWEFNKTNLFYFSVDTLQNLLIRAGFGDPIVVPDRSLASVNYLRERLSTNPRALQRFRWLRWIMSLTPVFRDKTFRLSHGRTRLLVRSKVRSFQPLLSVIVPVYNEAATFAELIDGLLQKTIDGLEIEVILVESNSSDGSRDIALRYENHPRVRLILEDTPKGKGHAVRNGLKAATGEIVLFQDADLEYDIDDYDALVAPLLRFQSNFVLGSRHSVSKNRWKIRQFSDSPGLAAFFNFGHILFLTLFNVLYSQRLTDPFTMFKVFRRECLYGLDFECNRFDFDYEIVIKLLRKGYKPLELPVNYRSRSLSEGKKVTVFRDPLTWIWALVKFRNTQLYSARRSR
jgi:Glycosyl transferase family 2